MFKNYFLLNRFVIEAERELSGSIITSAFTQDKNRIVLALQNKSIEKHVEISVEHGFPYITIKPQFTRAKKNSAAVYPDCFPTVLQSITIASSDRIIKFKCASADLYFAIRGKYTNVFLADGDKIVPFKNTPEESENEFLTEVESVSFIAGFNHPSFKVEAKEELRKKYPFLGREIIQEAESRTDESESLQNYLVEIDSILHEIENKNIAVFVDEVSSEIHIAPETFQIFIQDKKETFSSFVDAFNFYLRKKYFLESTQSLETKIKRFLDRELEKLSSKINILQSRLKIGSRADEYEKIGNILLINLHSLRTGLKRAEMEDIYNNGNLLTIKLQEALTPKQNADYYFDKARNERVSREKSTELLRETMKKYEKYLKLKSEAEATVDLAELKRISRELNLKDEKNTSPKDQIQEKFKHYIIEEKYHVFVGKDSRSNDLLTTKFAKQNDYWFHARSVPGSHVVLRVDNTKEAVPKNILKKAAALAGYHSKAKTSGMAPVSYSLKKYVVKKKGMAPGKVALLKEDVLIVKPEIPAGCEFVSNN